MTVIKHSISESKSANLESIPDNPYAAASTDCVSGNPRVHPVLEQTAASRYSNVTILTSRIALAVTALCWTAVGLFPKPTLAAFYFGVMFTFPYVVTELATRMVSRYRRISLLLMLSILALSGLRLFIAVTFAFVVTQIHENDGDNMISILPMIDMLFVAPMQLALTIAFGGYGFWRNRRIE